MRNRNKRGFSLIELLIVVAIILIIAAISIPSLLRSRIAAHDAAAAQTIKALDESQISYAAAYPVQGFANSLAALGPGNPPVACSVPANVTVASACLMDGTVGCPSTTGCAKTGYKFFLSNTAAAPPYTDYTVSAGPIGWGLSGSANWCSYADAVIRSTKGLATQPTASLNAPETMANCANPTAYVPAQ
jgi:prepilin-type N-terminal cleavage/methylation domain-containing protein